MTLPRRRDGRPYIHTPETRAKVIAALTAGLPCAEAARLAGVATSTAHGIGTQAGIIAKPVGRRAEVKAVAREPREWAHRASHQRWGFMLGEV